MDVRSTTLAVIVSIAAAGAGCTHSVPVAEPSPPAPAVQTAPAVRTFDSRLVGSWLVIGGDYPLVNEFRSDGTLVQRVGKLAGEPRHCRTEGNQLITSWTDEKGEISEGREKYEVDGDTLTLIDDGFVTKFRRR